MKGLTGRAALSPWKRAEESAREPGGPHDSRTQVRTTGDGPGEPVLRVDPEGEDGRVEERSSPGEGLRGGVGGFRGAVLAMPGDGGPPGDEEASRCRRANSALRTLAELLWGAGAEWSSSGPPSCVETRDVSCTSSSMSSEGLSDTPGRQEFKCLLSSTELQSDPPQNHPRTQVNGARTPTPRVQTSF